MSTKNLTALFLSLSTLAIPAALLAEAPATTPAANPTTEPTTPSLVAKGTIHPELQVSGYLQAIDPQIVKLEFKQYAGKLEIAEVIANGAVVKTGQTLIKFKDDEYKKALITAENEAKTADAALAKTRVENDIGVKADALALSESERSLKQSQDALAWWDKVDGPHILKRYELQLKDANDRVDDQSEELDQLKKMYKSEDLTNATSDIVVKRAVRSFEESKIALEMTKAELEKDKAIEYPPARQMVADGVTKAEQALALLQATQAQSKIARETSLSAAELAAEAAKKKLGELKEDAKFLEIKSTRDGVALWGKLSGGAWSDNGAEALKVGEESKPGSELMLVYKPGQLKAVASVEEKDALRILAGQAAKVTPTALPEAKTSARAEKISPTGVADHYEVPLTLESASSDLRPGMKVSVHFKLLDIADAIIVPNSAIKDGKVTVIKDGKSEPRDITFGQSDGENTQVINGLQVGEEVEH